MDSLVAVYDKLRLDIIFTTGGIVVGIAGFALALVQIGRVRRTSDSVRDQVQDLRSRLSHASAVESLASALAIVDDLRRLHRNQTSTAILPDRYVALVRLLAEVQCSDVLDEKQKTTVQQASITFRRTAELIEADLQTGKMRDPAKLSGSLLQQYERLATLLAELKQEMGGA